MKVLAIKFKYLGDIIIATPALKAIKAQYPEAELHVLTSEDAAPLLESVSWIDKVWHFPRTRGKKRLKDSWPILKALRKERFDRSVDFVGNDRGAILSKLIGAKVRLGIEAPLGFWGRKLCYTQAIEEADLTKHEVVRDLHVLSAWNIPFPDHPEIEIAADPKLKSAALEKLGSYRIIGHLATSQEKKEWPIAYWAELFNRCKEKGIELAFTSGPSEREQALLGKLQSLAPDATVIREIPSLGLFLALLKELDCFISPDTGPLHMAAGLGTKTLALFGPTATSRWAPLGDKHSALQGSLCPCTGHQHTCTHTRPCIKTIAPEAALSALEELLSR